MHPISFKPDMVSAIRDGRKCMTRRPVKGEFVRFEEGWSLNGKEPRTIPEDFSPYGQEGDKLWVREDFCYDVDRNGQKVPDKFLYKADFQGIPVECYDKHGNVRYNKDGSLKSPWKINRFMPRKASRLTLEITSLRVERLQDISEEEAVKEGFNSREELLNAWASMYPKGEPNPWVWVIGFKVVNTGER